MARAKRICPKPGCPKPAAGRYCPEHNREYEQKRGTARQRGYDARHDAARRTWAALVRGGGVHCARCHGPIDPAEPWHLDHDDADRTRYIGASHARCNTSAGGKRAHEVG